MSLILKSVILVAFLASLPFLTELALRKEFVVHTRGIVLVTGASSGIGKGAAAGLAEKGFVVFASVRKEKDALKVKEESALLNKSAGGDLIPVILDVTNPKQVDTAFAEISEYMKQKGLPFVGLVNNAGLGGRCPVEAQSIEKARQMFEINFWGVLSLTQKFLPAIRSSQGRVVFVSSLLGATAVHGSGMYSASKHALEGMADSLRLEMQEFGVSVSIINPGFINTSISDAVFVDPSKDVTPENLKLYANFFENMKANRKKSFVTSAPVSVTTDVIVHSLMDPYPRTRYAVGPAGGFDARVIILADAFLPDRLMDILRNKQKGN